MTYETKMEKTERMGWRASTVETLAQSVKVDGGNDIGDRILKLRTYKNSRGVIESFASVSVIVDRGGYKMEQTVIFGDFTKTVYRSDATRATEKTVREAHEKALEQWPQVIAEAKAFYGSKEQNAA